MTQYLHIRTPSGPAYAGQDANDRHMWGFPLEAEVVAPGDDFEGEIAKRLFDAGLITGLIVDRTKPVEEGDTITGGTFPDGREGPYFRLLDTGGGRPVLERGPKPASSTYLPLSMSVTARGQDKTDTRNRLTAIHKELREITNTELVA